MVRLIIQCSAAFVFGTAIAWASFSTFPSQGILWVDDDDPTCGGQSPCYQTIQEAVAAAQPGDTIKVRPGAYQGQIIISKDLTLSGESPELVFIREGPLDPDPRRWGVIAIIGPAIVTIENVTIDGTTIGILVQEAHITLSRTHLSHHLYAVHLAYGHLTLSNSWLSQNEFGVSLTSGGSPPSRIEGNHFENNAVAITVDQRSIVIIRDNKIVGRQGRVLKKSVGIEIKGSTEALLQFNTIQNNEEDGVLVHEGANAYLESNHITDNRFNGVIVDGMAQVTLVRNQILRNGFGGRFGVLVNGGATVELVENRLEGNLFGLGAFQAFAPGAKRIPHLNAQKNRIVGNGWGVFLRGAAATLRNNEITHNESSALAIDPDLTLFFELGLGYPTSGVLVQAGQPLLEANLITQNRRGVVLQWQASPTLRNNQIINNTEYGIALYRRPCFDQVAASLRFQGNIAGEANELSGNGKTDLCPADYPWPPGFKK